MYIHVCDQFHLLSYIW